MLLATSTVPSPLFWQHLLDAAVSGIPEGWLLVSFHANRMNLSKAMQWGDSFWEFCCTEENESYQRSRLLSPCSSFTSWALRQSCSCNGLEGRKKSDLFFTFWLFLDLTAGFKMQPEFQIHSNSLDLIPSGFTPGKIDWSLVRFQTICVGLINSCSDLPQEGPGSSRYHLSGYCS